MARRALPVRLCGLVAVALLASQAYLGLRFVSLDEPQPDPETEELTPYYSPPPDTNNINNSSLRYDELDFPLPCRLSSKEATSAVRRARTAQCKRSIVETACAVQNGQLYAPRLDSSCTTHRTAQESLGCFRDEKDKRLLASYYANYRDANVPRRCVDVCLQGGFPYAGLQYSTECFCGETRPPSAAKIADSSCNMKCPGDARQLCGGYFTMNVYATGIEKFTAQTAASTTDETTTPVRIVFLLTLNGRASRQVRRLIDALYDPRHYFYIHVDARQDYLFRELISLENEHSNIRLTRKRFATIWGGASLLETLLTCMSDLLSSDWQWDFVINLSESDFPVKSVDRLEEFLSANRGKNFVKSHGREVQRFIQKQGLDKTFVECDAHMWRVGDRKLPWGIEIDGGSDWVALDRTFVSYVVSPERDELIEGLLVVFKHTLLPAESFFHTVLRNSKFCDTYVDNNLHVTNWKRKLGCKCQYKHVVDWCGCSPNDFRTEDWPRLQATERRQLFFARKFEPIVNQAIILRVEQWIQNAERELMTNIDAYWQNTYHHADSSPRADDSLVTIAASITRLNSKTLSEEACIVHPGLVKEVTSYNYADVYKGSLVLHEAVIDGFGPVRLETWFKYRQYFQVSRSSRLYERLKVLAVSSDFDQKEQTFRNLMRSLGPHSEPSLMYHFVPSVDEPLATSNVTFVWFDPIGNIIDIADVVIFEGNVLNFIKPNLKVPLLPGVWIVKVIESKKIVAVTKFLVTPLQFSAGKETTLQEVRTIHANYGGASKNFTSHDKLVKSLMQSPKEMSNLRSTAEVNSEKIGIDLREWIDSLVLQFYNILGTCVVAKDIKNVQCGKVNLAPCHTTTWSSLAPDPKSFNMNIKKHSKRSNGNS